MERIKVFLARSEHLDEASRLFNQYRMFYQQPSNLKAAATFLQERFQNHDSAMFLAGDGDHPIGFVQLYPSFSSVSMKRIWILNDLFVEKAHRKQGVATLLMEAAEEFARETEAVRIVLATQIANGAAQSLYESLGYVKDNEFYHYALRL